MGRQRPQNTQEDRGYHGDGRGYDPQHLADMALGPRHSYYPVTATRVCVRYLVVCYRQIGAQHKCHLWECHSLAQWQDGIT